jgi:uncharacterized protein YdiU (UPF0061 family)
MDMNKADFTLTFYYLSQFNSNTMDSGKNLRALFERPEQIDSWIEEWRKRLSEETVTDEAAIETPNKTSTEARRSDELRQEKMLKINPVYIPRNHQIEAAIRAAEDNNDFSVFHKLHAMLQKPYEIQKGGESYISPPKPDEVVAQTFCGT